MNIAPIFRDAAAFAEERGEFGFPIAAIWRSQDRQLYFGCVAAEEKFKWLYAGCVAENSAHGVLMLLFAAEFCDG